MKKAIPPFRGQYIPLSQRLVQGAIGELYVIKHYRKKRLVVKTKYPNMQGIIPSTKQKIFPAYFSQSCALCSKHLLECGKKIRMAKKASQATPFISSIDESLL
jgi:hypothetical protein